MNIQGFLEYMAEKYYEGSPVISDEEFDSICEKHGYTSVGTKVQEGVEHIYRLYSLQKFYVGETPPCLKKELLVETPKLDGAAISLTYVNGSLVSMLTRGDGKVGKDITHLSKGLNLPEHIDCEGILQIIGEVIAPKTIENARNYASGSLGLKDFNEFCSRNVHFVAYGVHPYLKTTYKEDMNCLSDFGFNTVLKGNLSIYPQDGKVFRLNNNKSFDNMEYTASHPRGAYALKTRTAGIVTKLLDVIWQVGRTGEVSPVAVLEPVVIGEATVARATLHNIAYINSLGLEIGCNVEVIRSGEVIPRIVRRVY